MAFGAYKRYKRNNFMASEKYPYSIQKNFQTTNWIII